MVLILMILDFGRSEDSHSAKWEVPVTFLGRAKADEGMRFFYP